MCRNERGAALMLTFLVMLVMMGLATAAAVHSQNSLLTGRAQLWDARAYYVTEAGWQRARQALAAGTWVTAPGAGNIYTESFGPGEYRITVVDEGSNVYTVTAEGYVPSQAAPVARRQIIEDGFAVTVSNGANYSLAATASASSSNGGNTPDKANDGNNGTKWQAGTNGSGSWLAMDHGVSPPALNRIVVDEDGDINGMTVEWSDNGSSWTAASGLSVAESPAKTWTATFTAAAHRYYRAYFTSVTSTKKATVTEMKSYASTLSTVGAGEVTTAW